MKSKGLFILVICAIAAMLLVAGCTDDKPASEKDTIVFGYQPSTHQISYMVAMDKGWWKQDLAPFGITKIEDHKFPTGAPEMQAMLSGDIDVAYVGAAPVISALATGGLDGAKIVAAVQVNGSDLVIRNEHPYNSPQDLKGLKIATFPPGTIQDTILRDWLQSNGVNPHKDVDIRPMGPGDATVAISEKAVDAVFLPHPAPSTIVAEGHGYIAVHSGEMAPNHACCVLVVSGDLIRNHPDMVVQIIKTHIKGSEFSTANIDEASQIYYNMNKVEIAVIKDSFATWDGRLITDPSIIIPSVVSYTKIQADLGYIPRPMTADEIFDVSFYQKATQA
ncbi:MAG: ABC transporter substrate-binding protein [Methanomicrobiales archaeon]|nr:ABC transporter substrate-binding protein [Methanomicrobiales archaeon]